VNTRRATSAARRPRTGCLTLPVGGPPPLWTYDASGWRQSRASRSFSATWRMR
jgi:hypothetical protein